MEDGKNETKEFSLKPIETNILMGIQQQMANITSLVLSYIAVDRLAYPVEQTSHFELSADLKTLKIREITPPAEAPKLEVAGDGDTAQAIKGEK